MTAADIGNRGTRHEFVNDAIESWQPVLHEIRHKPDAEESVRTAEATAVMIVPAPPSTGAKYLNGTLMGGVLRLDLLEKPLQTSRAAFPRKYCRLLGGEREGVILRIIPDIAGRRICD